MGPEIILLDRLVFVLAVFLFINKMEDENMGDLSAFLAQNAAQDESVMYIASKRFAQDGKSVEWEIHAITSEEDEQIRKSCTKKVPVTGKKGQYTQELDAEKYLGLLAAKCIVYPNLNATELQDSYKVMGADAVLKKMLKPGEYQELLKKIQEINGFNTGMDDLVEEAKN